MDALVKLLVEQYGMKPAEAQSYAQTIHGQASYYRDHAGGYGAPDQGQKMGNPDSLQTEAYQGATGSRTDFKREALGALEADKDPQTILARMGRLKRNAELFTDIASRRAQGEQLSPEHEGYYNQVTQIHQRAQAKGHQEYVSEVAQRGRDAIRGADAGHAGYRASEGLRHEVNGLVGRGQDVQAWRQADQAPPPPQYPVPIGPDQYSYPEETPEQLADIQRYYANPAGYTDPSRRDARPSITSATRPGPATTYGPRGREGF